MDTAGASGVAEALLIGAGLLFWGLVLFGTVVIGAAINGKAGARVGGLIFLILFIGFFLVSAINDQINSGRYEKRRARELRGIAICQAELPAVAPEYIVTSLLLETGAISENRLLDLLGKQGLQFVEMKSHALDGERMGIGTVNGDSVYKYYTNVQYVRIALAPKGDPQCAKDGILGLYINDHPRAPISPDACVRIETGSQSSASHQ